MLEKRIVSAICDQLAIVTVSVEALLAGARRYSRGYPVECKLRSATENLMRACRDLGAVEQAMAEEE